MEAFTEDLVTDLLRHGPGLSLARIADERRVADILPRIDGTEIEYVVTGSAQRSGPQTFRVNVQIADAATAEYRWAGQLRIRPRRRPGQFRMYLAGGLLFNGEYPALPLTGLYLCTGMAIEPGCGCLPPGWPPGCSAAE